RSRSLLDLRALSVPSVACEWERSAEAPRGAVGAQDLPTLGVVTVRQVVLRVVVAGRVGRSSGAPSPSGPAPHLGAHLLELRLTLLEEVDAPAETGQLPGEPAPKGVSHPSPRVTTGPRPPREG